MSTTQRSALLLLALLGAALYLWPMLCAPPVVNSDSMIDLRWAQEGAGIVTPAFAPNHSAKPGYILFLRAASYGRGVASRRVVVAQSLLLWTSIAGTALLVARRLGAGYGIALYAVAILFLRLRDSTSIVMTEALAAALFLPFAALLLDPPKRPRSGFLLGVFAGAVFLVRPNVGAGAALLAILALAVERRWRVSLFLSAGFAVLTLPVLLVTSPPQDPLRGLNYVLAIGASPYGWVPGINLSAGSTVDSQRALAWRFLHGLLGTDFYDARWSSAYRFLTEVSRMVAPLVILCSIAVLLSVSFRANARFAKPLGITLVLVLVAQSAIFGALPRHALPFLPAVFLYALIAAAQLPRESAARRVVSGILLVLLLVVVARQRQILDWEWGEIEAAGVRIHQTIPRGALPPSAPATLHLRIAPLVLPSGAHLEVLGPEGELLFRSIDGAARESPVVSLPLTEALLRSNRSAGVTLTVLSVGDYDSVHFLLFPVIPPPWGRPARREGSAELSPQSGIASGSLDWWAHSGSP